MTTAPHADVAAEPPPPPAEQTGWPWTHQAPPVYEDACDWPRITIVTPSYNQGKYIEGTIRSVLLQDYPDLEYIVIDGGSADRTVEIIRKYEPWITYWESQSDRGQSHAINKGFARATGEVYAWLNSDDQYAPGALAAVGRHFGAHPACQWLAGAAAHAREGQGQQETFPAHLACDTALLDFWRFGEDGYYMKQSSIFWRKSLWDAAGPLLEPLHLAMDHDLWLKFDEHADLETIDELLSVAFLHEDCKSLANTRKQVREAMRCCYAAAARRGRGRRWLTRRMLAASPRWRLGRIAKSLRLRWWGGVARDLLGLLTDPVRLWSESGRLAAIRGREG